MKDEDGQTVKTPLAEVVQIFLSFAAAVLAIVGAAVLWGLGGALLVGSVVCIVLVILIGTVI